MRETRLIDFDIVITRVHSLCMSQSPVLVHEPDLPIGLSTLAKNIASLSSVYGYTYSSTQPNSGEMIRRHRDMNRLFDLYSAISN